MCVCACVRACVPILYGIFTSLSNEIDFSTVFSDRFDFSLAVNTKELRALRGFFGPLWSKKLKVAFSQISSDWFIKRIAKV